MLASHIHGAIGQAAKCRVIVKSGAAWKMGKVDCAAFDRQEL
ncbi:MAG: hypothetical protein ACLUKN_17140 [Bacilli bacterium]